MTFLRCYRRGTIDDADLGTPEPEGAEYVAVCLPAFSPETVHRDPE
jgi:hypothetical protein